MKIPDIQIGDVIHGIDNVNGGTIAATVVFISPCVYQFPVLGEFRTINDVSVQWQFNYCDIIRNVTTTMDILTEL